MNTDYKSLYYIPQDCKSCGAGRTVFRKDISSFAEGKNSLVIPCDNWNNGLYFVTFRTNIGSSTFKIVKQ